MDTSSLDLPSLLDSFVRGEFRLRPQQLTPEQRVVMVNQALDMVKPELGSLPDFQTSLQEHVDSWLLSRDDWVWSNAATTTQYTGGIDRYVYATRLYELVDPPVDWTGQGMVYYKLYLTRNKQLLLWTLRSIHGGWRPSSGGTKVRFSEITESRVDMLDTLALEEFLGTYASAVPAIADNVRHLVNKAIYQREASLQRFRDVKYGLDNLRHRVTST